MSKDLESYTFDGAQTQQAEGDHHSEKDESQTYKPDLGIGGRRESVALNIVENPLKVSISSLFPNQLLLLSFH